MPRYFASFRRVLPLCFILFLSRPAVLLAASYDCAKAKTPAEKAICADPLLSSLDDQLGLVYRQLMRQLQEPEKSALKTSQFAWLRELAACMGKAQSNECIRVAYETRLDFLGGAPIAPGAPGASSKDAPAPSARTIPASPQIPSAPPREPRKDALPGRDEPGLAWLLNYAGKSTNEVAWDPKFKRLLEAVTPPFSKDLGMGKEDTLAATVREFIGGPPDDARVEDKRYVTLSACRAHSCQEKAWLWFDLEEKGGVGALVHYIYGKDVSEAQPDLLLFSMRYGPGQFPEKARLALRAWLRDNDLLIRKTRFVNAKAEEQELPSAP
jgi:uncharacterized protein